MENETILPPREPSSATSHEEAINRSIFACQSAATQDELEQALKTLRNAPCWGEDQTALVVRENAAIALVQTLVCTTRNHRLLDDCILSCCKTLATFNACVETLRAATNKNPMLKSQFGALQTTLRLVKRIMCSASSSEADAEEWVKELFLDDGFQNPTENQSVMISTINCFVELVLLLPTKIASACHSTRVDVPLWAIPSRYHMRLLECSFQMVRRLHSNSDSVVAKTARSYFKSLVGRLVHYRRASDDVASALYQCHQEKATPTASPTFWSDKDFSDLILETIRQVPTYSEKALLLRSILRHVVATGKDWNNGSTPTLSQVDRICQDNFLSYLNITCVPILQESRQIRDAWVQLVVLSQSSAESDDRMDQMFCHCVALLLLSCSGSIDGDMSDSDDDDSYNVDGNTEVIRKHLNAAAASWSQGEFLRKSSQSLQNHVTNFIMSTMWLYSGKKEGDPDLAHNITRGVSIRLECSAKSSRKNGMLVGELFARRLGEELRFDELQDTDRDFIIPPSQSGCFENPNQNESELEVSKKERDQNPKQGRLRQRNFLDPDADYVSDDESELLTQDDEEFTTSKGDDDDAGSIWDDVDELVPYDLEDDEEDLRVAPRPCYLSECLQMLRTPDTDDSAYCQQLTALQELPTLVRSRPTDLADYIHSLIMQLLRAENKFKIEGFEDMILTSLFSLAVEEPVLAGRCLITEFFEEGSYMDRMNVLRTLQDAAYQLSAVKDLKGRIPDSISTRIIPATDLRSELRQTVDVNGVPVEIKGKPRTRRWRTTYPVNPFPIRNMFGQVAPTWFYTLVHGFLQRKDKYALWGGASGARLLASFLLTLATFVECAGYSPGASILAKDLIELVWTFRTAEIADVRISVLACISTSITVLPEDEVANVMIGTSDLVPFLEYTMREDPSQESKAIAAGIIQTVGSAFDALQNPNRLT